ncbi:MAG: hypothetical protein HQK86_06210 [Nitrospinae bacterium]|nr:hypothetical protein [Nitrospinota bacterium]MBF0634674.1 hypothetical protein [Nitrospinota bacterium]
MNGWVLAGVALLWAISVAALIILIRRWRIVEAVDAPEKPDTKARAIALAQEALKKKRASASKKTDASLEILTALAQDEKLMAGQIKKWLSEKDDFKKK